MSAPSKGSHVINTVSNLQLSSKSRKDSETLSKPKEGKSLQKFGQNEKQSMFDVRKYSVRLSEARTRFKENSITDDDDDDDVFVDASDIPLEERDNPKTDLIRNRFSFTPNRISIAQKSKEPIGEIKPRRETFKAKISRLKSTTYAPHKVKKSKSMKSSKKSMDSIFIHDINSDFDITYGRPKALRGYYFNLEWWWLQFSESSTHRTLVLLLAFLLTLSICHCIFSLIMMTSGNIVPNPYLCKTVGCNLAAERIINSMNDNFNNTKLACSNFYSFVCGNHTIDEVNSIDEEEGIDDEHQIDIFERGALSIDSLGYNFIFSRSLGRMLREMAHHAKLKKPLEFYQSCLDHRSRNLAGVEPYYRLLKEYDLWSLKNSTKSIGSIVGRLYKDFILSTPLFRIKLHPEIQQYEILRAVYDDVASIFLYGFSTFNNTMRKLLSHVREELNVMSNELGDLASNLSCVELALFHYNGTERVQTESELGCPTEINLFPQDHQHTTNQYKEFFIAVFNQSIKNIQNWTEVKNTNLSPTEKIHRAYLNRALNSSLILRFLQWRILIEYSGNLDDDTFKLECPIKKIHKKCNRLTACFWSTFEVFPHEVTVNFVKSIERRPDFNHQMKFMVDSIVKESVGGAHNVTLRNIDNSTMFNELFIQSFNVSVKTIVDDHSGESEVPEYEIYKNVTVGKNYFENILTFRRLQGSIQVLADVGDEKATKWVNLQKYQLDLYTNNLAKNKLVIAVPLGGAEPPHFQSNFPALDLSGLGFSIASSISRLVILEHLRAPADAFRLHNAITSESLRELHKDEQRRILDVYSDGIKTLSVKLLTQLPQNLWTLSDAPFEGNSSSFVLKSISKILSDSFALKVMYHLHEIYLKKIPRNANQQLIGLEHLTPQQLFFINLVSFKCQKYTNSSLQLLLKNGPIPLPMAINIMMANSNEFVKTFDCPINTTMNVLNKISLSDI